MTVLIDGASLISVGASSATGVSTRCRLPLQVRNRFIGVMLRFRVFRILLNASVDSLCRRAAGEKSNGQDRYRPHAQTITADH